MTEDESLDLTEELLLQGDEARKDPAKFFNFVMEQELTRERLKVAPHQRVLLEFIQAHKKCVIRLPIDHTKTFTTGGYALWMLGKDPTMRGAVISATQGLADKPLAMVRDYIEHNDRLNIVFPRLKRSSNTHDSWSQTEITVERPYGIRDASLVACGYKGAIAGSRLGWIMVDDLFVQENTGTQDLRQQVFDWLQATVQARLDRVGGRMIITNTPWHPDDGTHRLEKEPYFWPTLTMRVTGEIVVANTDWDSELLRPTTAPEVGFSGLVESCRLVAHDPDPKNDTPLWPERYPPEVIAEKRRDYLPHRFNQLYMAMCRDDDTARCKAEWIEACKKLAREEAVYSMVSFYKGENPTFTGVDLAVSPGEEHDDCAFFTFEARPNGTRVLLDLEIGQFDGPTIVKKLFEKAERYNSILRVENNAAQDFIRQFALAANKSLPIKAHTTGRVKAHPEHGVEGFFIELANAAWLIPNDKHGQVHKNIKRLIDACLYYSPAKHTDDALMACYFAREQAKAFGVLRPFDPSGGGTGKNASLAATIMAR